MGKSEELPHAKRGRLKNGNPSGNPMNSLRCGSHARRTGWPCRGPAMRNGRCRMHGGRSTGPRTEEGRQRAKIANFIHGMFSAEQVAENKECRELIKQFRELQLKINTRKS
jgi:hypothetical protein